jgi:hypothetical protein
LVEEKPAKKAEPWRALHLINSASDKDLEALGGQAPRLAPMGLNVVILEVDYGFRFQAYPKLRRGRDPITPEGAAKASAGARWAWRPLLAWRRRFGPSRLSFRPRGPRRWPLPRRGAEGSDAGSC